jgi:hypothetical protein
MMTFITKFDGSTDCIYWLKERVSVSYYVPLYSGGVRALGLTENSLVEGELDRVDDEPAARPAHEIEAELTKLK